MTTTLKPAPAEAQAVARTILQQIGNRTLSALKPSLMTFEGHDNGNTTLRFAIGNTNGKNLRKIEITYVSGRDTYDVRSILCSLYGTAAGTTLGYETKYEAEDVYCDVLAPVVLAAARGAGARPRI